MNVRKVNLTLWSLTTVLAGAAVLCAAWGLLMPVEVEVDRAATSRNVPATSQASPDTQFALDAFAPIWSLTLRKPLDDTTSSTTQKPDPATSAPTATAGAGGAFALVGTIGETLAMIRTPDGQIEIKSVGELANGAKILAIRPLQVDVEVNGERMTIAKAREGGGS